MSEHAFRRLGIFRRLGLAMAIALSASVSTGCLVEHEETEREETEHDTDQVADERSEHDELATDDDWSFELGARCPDGDSDHVSDPQPDPWHARRVPLAPNQEPESEGDDDGVLWEPQPDPWHGESAAADGAGRERSDRDGE